MNGQEKTISEPVLSNDFYTEKRLGWLPDVPDFRDYTMDNNKLSEKDLMRGKTLTVKQMLTNTGMKKSALKIPNKKDLRSWFSPIEDQGNLGSCTANAGVGMYEYYERRAFGKHIDGSRLFLYKTTRNLMHASGDSGAYIRTTMGAMSLFGIPPEEYWPYQISRFDNEPNPFCYAFGQNFQALSYFRLDPNGTTPQHLLNSIKNCIAAGLPSMFGFTVYNSIYQAENDGMIPYPVNSDDIIGGHAVVAVGYDDTLKICNEARGSEETKGAFIIRNSWGTGFGDHGYCYLPYDYVLNGLADDWWVMLKAEWVNTGNFAI
ncbi:MAG: cysteine protease [Bacteroidetes bacterium]|nr:cysteine protease [Bacteroidota bacterium]MBP6648827.1 cysteine protease [Bacteroidia bacterium]